MRWFQAGLALRLNVHLQVDELPVQADGGTVAWQMRDQTGAIVGDPERTGSPPEPPPCWRSLLPT